MERALLLKKIDAQRAFFAAGKTRPVEARLEALRALRDAIAAMEDEINAALKADLGKSATESYMCETGMVLSEISHMLKHARRYSRPLRARTPLAQFHASSRQLACPYGVALVMSPWNYPLMLALDPAVDAIAAGNTVVLKPSAYAPRTSEVLEKLVARALPAEWMFVVTGGRAENAMLLDCKFDYIFFTGGVNVGRLVMEKAAAHLTPVTLELGGKSPCIVDRTANLELAAKRIAFGKFLNCGQTCVAPDYIYCDEAIREPLVEALKRAVAAQYGARPLENPNYGRIVNRKHFDRLTGLIDPAKVALGGECDESSLRIAPTILDGASFSDACMGEEIFGPILPVLTYRTLDEALAEIDARPHPLALYFFSADRAAQRRVMDSARFGGGCINDTIIHLATSNMPFGGMGESGMGGYHGRAGFETFTHRKSVVDKKTWLDLPMRYQPYNKLGDRLIRMFLR